MSRQYTRTAKWRESMERRRREGQAKASTMAALYQDGWTLQRIGDEYGMTRERVRQLLRKFTDIAAEDGGAATISVRRIAEKKARRDARYFALYGCSYEQRCSIPRKATDAFQSQRANARKRGISWEMTPWQWWTIWQGSGLWSKRGRGQGYVMCRRGDAGPYSPGNVFIALARHNSSDRKEKQSGLPIGVSRTASGKFTAQRMINRKTFRLGVFPTPGLAYAAYLQAGLLNEQEQERAA